MLVRPARTPMMSRHGTTPDRRHLEGGGTSENDGLITSAPPLPADGSSPPLNPAAGDPPDKLLAEDIPRIPAPSN